MTSVKLTDLLDGLEFSSFDGLLTSATYVCTVTGVVYFVSEGGVLNDDLPEDLETSDRYVQLPSKNELDLGRNLVFSFIENCLPEEYETVRGVFQKRGAYAKFKNLLERKGLLNQWYAYEQVQKESALRLWCEDNGFEVVP